ncbi:MAG: DUF503 domain-containing protein [bacterium]|nr:DUF503 domain-containing protein [bacterium]
MFILAAKITLFLNDHPKNLKEKRSLINSVKQKIINKFKVSIAEVADNEKLHITTIGLAIVSNNKKLLEQTIYKIENFLSGMRNVSVIEIITNYYSQ